MASLIVEAQQAAKTARVALLQDFTAGRPSGLHQAFREELQSLGWIEGRNVAIEERYAESADQRREVAAEMERLKVDVVVACSPCAFRAAPFGSTPITGSPVVSAGVSDPVGAHMAAALARPGGNMTGLSYLGIELTVKRLELLKEALPEISRVGALVPKNHPLRGRMVKEIEAAAQSLRLTLQLAEVADGEPPTAIDGAFDTFAKNRAEAVLGLQGPHYFRDRGHLAALMLKHRLPGIFESGPYAEAGCLMAYGPSFAGIYRQTARYVDRILKGA